MEGNTIKLSRRTATGQLLSDTVLASEITYPAKPVIAIDQQNNLHILYGSDQKNLHYIKLTSAGTIIIPDTVLFTTSLTEMTIYDNAIFLNPITYVPPTLLYRLQYAQMDINGNKMGPLDSILNMEGSFTKSSLIVSNPQNIKII